MEQELRQMFEMKGAEMTVPPTLSHELRNRVGRQRMIIGGLVAAAAVALVVGGFAGARSLSSDEALPPANPRPEGIFADVGGWIAYGDNQGIWAVDPTRPGDPADVIQLSSTPGLPRAWSPDGSKLLVLRDVKDSDPGGPNETDLFVLNPDGTETRLTDANGWVTGGSFSSDGSQVVYATNADDQAHRSFVWVIDASGGDPRPVHRTDAHLDYPTFSPDGRSIAYFEGGGDHSNFLRVMNAVGSDSRILVEKEFGHIVGLEWSPDGSRLVFASREVGEPGIWVVRADGTGLKQVSPTEFDARWAVIKGNAEGADPHWSPDGSLISYNTADPLSGTFDALVIARWDGTPVQEFDYGRSGPWNPLDP
jgi:Tol biopolymer transport system component